MKHVVFAGYMGGNCELEINECESAPCYNGATCEDLVGGYECQCVEQYYGDQCELKVDNCELNNTCLNGATCVDEWMAVSCVCPPMFTGPHCEKGR